MKRVNSLTNAFYSSLAWFVPTVLALLVTPLLVRCLGTEDYGFYALAVGIAASLVGLVSPIRTVVRHIATQARDELEVAARLIGEASGAVGIVGCLLGLIVAVGAAPAVDGLFGIGASSRGPALAAIVVASAAIPLLLTSQLFAGVAQGLLRFDLYGRLTLGLSGILVVGNGLLAVGGADLRAFMIWYLCAAGVSAVSYLGLARRLVPGFGVALPRHFALLRPHLRFGAGVFASQAPGHLLFLLERTWLVRGVGAAGLTHYVVPMTLGLSLHAAMSSVTAVLFPAASAAVAQGDLDGLLRMYSRAVKCSCACVGLAVTLLVVSGGSFLELWMGAPFAQESTRVLSLHAGAFGLLAMAIIPWQLVEAFGRPVWNVLLAMTWLLSNSLLLLVLVGPFGIDGAAFARLASFSLVPLYGAFVERLAFGAIQLALWRRLVPTLLLACATCAGLQWLVLAMLPTSWMRLGLGMIVGILGFSGCLWGMRYFTPQEREWLRNLRAKRGSR